MFSSLPAQVLTQEFYKALPYEKVKVQGLLNPYNLFIALRFNEASSSDYPPERKQTPTKAGTAVLDKAATVLEAISPGVILDLSGFFIPGVTMFGFKRHPSKKTF
jgi:hypothetical protein